MREFEFGVELTSDIKHTKIGQRLTDARGAVERNSNRGWSACGAGVSLKKKKFISHKDISDSFTQIIFFF